MFETTPKLPVTQDETAPYAPYSVLAVAAIAAAVFFAVMLILLGVSAWLAGQPLFEPVILLMPFVALSLAFVGRRHVLNSEGTRVGLPLCNAAWWIAIIGGIGYLMYLIGIGFAIRSDAEGAFNRWTASLVKINPVEPRNIDLATSFHGTLSPDKQPTLMPSDTAKLYALHNTALVAFRQSDLVRLVHRNAKDIRFDVVGLEDWKNENNSLVCKLTVHVICPEGEYSMSVPMQKQTLKGQSTPTWQIIPPQNEQAQFLKSARLTDYGERIRDMEMSAQQLVYSYFLTLVALKSHQPQLFDVFGKPQFEPQKAIEQFQNESLGRMALNGGIAWEAAAPGDNYASLMKRHFVPLDKGDAAREEELRKEFARCWRGGNFATPTSILAKNPDVGPILVPLDGFWEIRVPIEIQPPGAERSAAAARAVVVCRVDDPAFLAELDALRAAKGNLHDGKPRFNAQKPVPWKVVRIESDLKMVQPPRPQPGAGD